MKGKLLFILAAGALTIGGCAGVADSLRARSPRKVANGDTGSFTANITAKNTITCTTAPNGTTFNLTETYSTSTQMTKDNSQTLAVNMPDNYYLAGLTLKMKSNSKGGAGNLTINGTTIISTASFNTSSWYGSWSTSYVDVVVDNDDFDDFISGNDVNDFTIVITATANSLYCNGYTIAWGYYEDTNTYHTVSFDSLGGDSCDAKQVIEGGGAGTLPTPTKAKDEANQKRYVFQGWYALSNTDNPANPTFEGATEYTASTPIMSDITLYAKYQEISYYKVMFNSLGGSAVDTQEVDAGQKASTPTAPTKASDNNYNYAFAGWYREEGCVNAYDFDDAVNANITLFAKWNQSDRPAKDVIGNKNTSASLAYSAYEVVDNSITDELDRAFTGVPDQSPENIDNTYEDWADKAGTSGVVYAGNSAGDHNSIQLRSNKSTAGIIVTANTTGQKAGAITVKWNENTTDTTRIIQVYGKDTAYTAASQLYSNDSNIKGSLVAEVPLANAVNRQLSIIFEDTYEFIGIRSKSGAQYIDSFEIQWGEKSYNYENLGIRFSASVSEELWNRLDTESDIQGYGVLLSTPEFLTGDDLKDKYDLADDINVKKFTNADTDHEENGGVKDIPTLKDGNYVWNLYKRISFANAAKNYVAVAFIQLAGDEVVFLNQVTANMKDLAQDLIDNDPNYNAQSFGGSLSHLANA